MLEAQYKIKVKQYKNTVKSKVDLLLAFAIIESIINTSTILSTQRRINRIATSHSKMGVLLVSMKVALSSNEAVVVVFEAYQLVEV